MLGWKTYSAMPMWKRFLFAAPVAALLFWIALSLQAWVWTEVAAAQIADEMDADVEYDDTFFDLHGGFGATDVRFTKYSPDGSDSVTFKVDRVTVQTPGLGWMFWNTLFDTTDELPDRLGIEFDNLRNVADDDTTPGNYTNLPYDAMGCVPSALTPTDLRTMGVPTQRKIAVLLERDTDAQSTGTFRLRTDGAGEMEMQVKLDLQRPVRLETWGDTIETAALQSVQLTFNDLGYIAKRNAYCAKKHSLTAKAFSDYHMQEVARFTAAGGSEMGQGTLDQYRDFADNGGTLQMRTAGTRKLTIVQFATMDRLQKMRAYPVMISANGKAPAFFAYGPASAAQTPVAAATPAMAAPAVATPVVLTTAQAGALPAPGSLVPREALDSLTGQHVDVTTSYGTVRKGVLQLVGPLAMNLQLDKVEGGILLTMPLDRVTDVRYTPIQSTADAPAPVAAQAQ